VVHLGGEQLESHPVVPVKRVIVYGNAQITTQAVKSCMAEGIEILYFTAYGKY